MLYNNSERTTMLKIGDMVQILAAGNQGFLSYWSLAKLISVDSKAITLEWKRSSGTEGIMKTLHESINRNKIVSLQTII